MVTFSGVGENTWGGVTLLTTPRAPQELNPDVGNIIHYAHIEQVNGNSSVILVGGWAVQAHASIKHCLIDDSPGADGIQVLGGGHSLVTIQSNRLIDGGAASGIDFEGPFIENDPLVLLEPLANNTVLGYTSIGIYCHAAIQGDILNNLVVGCNATGIWAEFGLSHDDPGDDLGRIANNTIDGDELQWSCGINMNGPN